MEIDPRFLMLVGSWDRAAVLFGGSGGTSGRTCGGRVETAARRTRHSRGSAGGVGNEFKRATGGSDHDRFQLSDISAASATARRRFAADEKPPRIRCRGRGGRRRW
jgi:hypothetical protein